MADRKASVSLELKAGQFKAEASVIEVKIELIDRKVDKLDRSITKIPPDAAKAAAAMKLLGDETGKAHLKLEDLGRSSTSLGMIDQKLAAARVEVRRFLDEFNKTGSAGSLQGFFKADREVKELERLQKSFARHLEQGAQDAAPAVSRSITSGFEGAGRYVIPGLIAAGIAASPLIGAALNGVLLTGVGLGGIALGIVGQIHDPAVRAALSAFGRDVVSTLGAVTEPFRGPLLSAIAIIRDALRGMLTGIDFKGLATTLAPLAAGIAGLIREMGPGLSAAFATAIPLLNTFAAELPNLGRGLSMFFDQISKGGEGAAEGLRSLIDFIVGSLAAIGMLIRVLSDLYAAFVRLGDGASDFARKAGGWIPILGGVAEKAHDMWQEIRFGNGEVQTFGRSLTETGAAASATADDFAKLTSQINQTRSTVDTTAGALTDRWLGALMGAKQATLGFEEALTRATDSIKQNGKTLDIHTAKGQANQEAIYAMVQANKALFDQMIANGSTMADATAKWDENTQRIYAWGQKVGIGKQQMDGLIGSMKSVPGQVNSAVAVKGLTDALDNLAELLRRLNGLVGERRITVKTVFETIGSPPPQTHIKWKNQQYGGIRHAAAGMVVAPREPGTLIGEPQTGGEALIPLRGISSGRAADLMRTAGAGYGLDVVPRGMTARTATGRVRVEVSVNNSAAMTPFDQALGSAVAYGLRTGVIQVKASQLLPG